ncbi:erythropoietin isoform X2 [Anabas testudineus]|uniref:erythropoietin isoform X2 n=1 Tax=Anabas testudineus TaxID=64144 RepID=UPI000E462C68|nr:erythropoietin isoform X2 [Anabas testudineus]
MEFPRLLTLLLIVLEWTRPAVPSPLRPICDLRVLNHFIKEARDTEVAMKLCREGCSLSESVTVPQTRVDFDVWEKKNSSEKAQEVQSGLWLLQQAFGLLQSSVTNTELHSQIENSIRNLHSINAVLRSLNIQEYTPPASAPGLEGTWTVSSTMDLLQVHVNFLRGTARDVKLLTCTLAAGSSVLRGRYKHRKGQSQLGFGWTGDDCTLDEM